MSKKEDAWVGCPYYKKETQQVIHCEGVEDGVSTNMAFYTPQKFKDYKQRYCYCNWSKCRVAKMLNEKYDYR